MTHNTLAELDRRFVWHPFTQMKDWMQNDPIVITEGKGAVLRDARGREYLDANSSIWTNLHGHRHPVLDAAVKRQLGKIAHSSALGLANEPASTLAALLVEAANPGHLKPASLGKVFYSDDGSTAIEAALKLSYEYLRRTRGRKEPRFLSLQGAYHGDTVGAVSLGHIDLFHRAYSGLLFHTDTVPSPNCYRCKHNRAAPERADARQYRKCNWECVRRAEQTFAIAHKRRQPYSAFTFEPLMQGAAGMIAQPEGWLARIAPIARAHGCLLIADEVLTGFGRTGTRTRSLFASHHEGVQPDLMALAKGLTGGYLPMAATLSSESIFEAFLGEYCEFKTFFHGHSYSGNQLGAAAGTASLKLLNNPRSYASRQLLETELRDLLPGLWHLPQVGDIRQVGLIAGIELVKNWRKRTPFEPAEQAGIRVCASMAAKGVLTRNVGNVVVIMPPYCTTARQLRRMIHALRESIEETLSEMAGAL